MNVNKLYIIKIVHYVSRSFILFFLISILNSHKVYKSQCVYNIVSRYYIIITTKIRLIIIETIINNNSFLHIFYYNTYNFLILKASVLLFTSLFQSYLNPQFFKFF